MPLRYNRTYKALTRLKHKKNELIHAQLQGLSQLVIILISKAMVLNEKHLHSAEPNGMNRIAFNEPRAEQGTIARKGIFSKGVNLIFLRHEKGK